MPACRPPAAVGRAQEATMIGTFVIILTAVAVAVLGCAWLAPGDDDSRVDVSTRQHRT
jgi:hypothetical protein